MFEKMKISLFFLCHTQKNVMYAGPEGIEPPSKVLETSILPLNYGPTLYFNYQIVPLLVAFAE